MGKRRQHSAEFKARVALEAVRGVKTVSEIAQEHQVHPVQVSTWKKELIERLPEVFGKKPELDPKERARQKERLERKIGELTMDNEFLKKKCVELGIPLDGQP
jgi:transposase